MFIMGGVWTETSNPSEWEMRLKKKMMLPSRKLLIHIKQNPTNKGKVMSSRALVVHLLPFSSSCFETEIEECGEDLAGVSLNNKAISMFNRVHCFEFLCVFRVPLRVSKHDIANYC